MLVKKQTNKTQGILTEGAAMGKFQGRDALIINGNFNAYKLIQFTPYIEALYNCIMQTKTQTATL